MPPFFVFQKKETTLSPNIRSQATGEEIEEIVGKMEDVLSTYPRGHVLMACLVVSLCIQLPEITSAQLQDGVLGVSKWIAAYLHSIEPDGDDLLDSSTIEGLPASLPPNKVN